MASSLTLQHQPTPDLLLRVHYVRWCAALAVGGMALARMVAPAVVGEALHHSPRALLLPNGAESALIFLLAAAALLLFPASALSPAEMAPRLRRYGSSFLAALITGIGLAVFVGNISHATLRPVLRGLAGILHLLGWGTPASIGSMTAFSFVLVGGTLLLKPHLRGISIYCDLLLGLFSISAIFGDGFQALLPSPSRSFLNLGTPVGFLLLTVGWICTFPGYRPIAYLYERGSSGWLLRRILPLALAFPLIWGWARAEALRGHRGLAQSASLLFFAAAVLFCVILAVFASNSFDRMDEIRDTAEEELRASEMRYRLLFHSNPEPLWVFDTETLRFLAVNDRACAKYGYSREEFLQMTIADIRPPEEIVNLMRRVTQLDPVMEDRFRHRTRDGSDLIVMISSHDLMWQHRPAKIVLARDITDTHQAETKLRRSETQVRLLLESSGEGICSLDLEGNCAWCNPAAARILGYGSPQDLLGRNMHALIHHTKADGSPYPVEECRLFAAFRSGRAMEIEDEVLWRADGTSFYSEHRCYPIFDNGEQTGLLITFIDVTERRHNQQALKASELRFRRLFERNLAGVFRTTVISNSSRCMPGGIVQANPAMAQLLGFESPAELLSCCNHVLYPTVEGLDSLVARLRAQGPQSGVEMQIRRRDGSLVWVLANYSLTVDDDGVAGIDGTVFDISENKKLEAQIQQSQKLEAVGRLAAGIAHDFNNLLTVINGYSDLLLSLALPAGIPPKVENIRKAGQRAAALTQQLLAFSRQQVLQPKVLDLNSVLTEMDPLLRRVISEDIDFKLVLAADAAPVKADPGQIEQVLMNLVVNARDAMPGGGKLTVETSNVLLDQEYAAAHPGVTAGQHTMLAVTDTGVGMAAATQERVFEPFFTTKPTGKGTGLGLATVFGIVKQSGGSIAIYSEPGLGTAMKVYLPSLMEQVVPPLPQPKTAAVAGGSETILVVEDSDNLRSLIEEILTPRGYRVLATADPEQALRVCAESAEPIQLLVSDVVLPGMNGRALSQQLLRQWPEMRVLFISGYPDKALLHNGALDASLAFLQKPFTPAALAGKVRELLEGVTHPLAS